MDEESFFWICCGLFVLSSCVLFVFVIMSEENSFIIEPYTSKVSCESGSCTFRATILELTDRNETVFYKLSKEVVVDSVFFVGTKKPAFVEGDCVIVSGTVQTYKGRESVVAQMLRSCSKSESENEIKN